MFGKSKLNSQDSMVEGVKEELEGSVAITNGGGGAS